MASINERFMDFQIAQQVRWIRFQNREVREALRILNRVDAQLATALRGANIAEGNFTQARLNALRIQVTSLITSIHSQVAPAVTSAMTESFKTSAQIEASAFKRILPAGVDVTTPNLGVLQTAATNRPFQGAVMSGWTNQLRSADLNRTWRTIVDGITSGTTTDDLIRSLNGTRALRYKDGVREVSRRGTEALVRTSINHATNTGRQVVWEKNRDLLKGVRWVSTLDTRTSPICQERDGKVGPVVSSSSWSPPQGSARLEPEMARPPAHINCRSTTTAVTKSWRELGFDVDELPPGTRASMNGQVPAKQTYYEWLKKQTDSVQTEVLGPVRFKMWKDGGISPDKFTNDRGILLTLDQLKVKSTKTDFALYENWAQAPRLVPGDAIRERNWQSFPDATELLDRQEVYFRSSYRSLNSHLRTGTELPAKYKDDFDAFLTDFKPISQSTTVYRGSRQLREFSIGDEISDAGFYATSLEPSSALSYLGSKSADPGTLYVIKVPKGRKIQASNNFESEVVMSPGSRFVVTKVEDGTAVGTDERVGRVVHLTRTH